MKKVKPVLQFSAVECGACSLSSILRYYGRYEKIASVRKRLGISRDGSKAKDILRAIRYPIFLLNFSLVKTSLITQFQNTLVQNALNCSGPFCKTGAWLTGHPARRGPSAPPRRRPWPGTRRPRSGRRSTHETGWRRRRRLPSSRRR